MDEILKGILKDLEIGIELTIHLYKKTNSVMIIDSTIAELNDAFNSIDNVEFRSCITGMIDGLNEIKSE